MVPPGSDSSSLDTGLETGGTTSCACKGEAAQLCPKPWTFVSDGYIAKCDAPSGVLGFTGSDGAPCSGYDFKAQAPDLRYVNFAASGQLEQCHAP